MLSSVLEQSLNVGVGISTGYVTVGNIGSPSRLEYTVIGGHVSLATRLADRAKPGQARPGVDLATVQKIGRCVSRLPYGSGP